MPVVVITPDYEVEIVPDPVTLDLKFLQTEVDGWIENVEIAVGKSRLQMWVNEEGLLKRLPYNPLATHLYNFERGPGGVIVGNVVITGLADGDAWTLSKAEFVALMDEIVQFTAVVAKWEEGMSPQTLDNVDK
jgi:hypothetical protein